jgi:RNA-directed DNA polymerase
MKRFSNLYQQICSTENIECADILARKGKSNQPGVIKHLRTREQNLLLLQQTLTRKEYKTSSYSIFKIYETKEREIYRLPFFPDRIVHHAIMNILEPIFVSTFTRDTYSCIKLRGIHAAANAVKKALRNAEETEYCLKLDIRKFYPNVDHDILKQLLRKKFKDVDLLNLLDEIIDSATGLPIGNYLSQYFANFYLTYFDHWLKEIKKVKHYFRYADDIVILHHEKNYLHKLFAEIENYLSVQLHLTVKSNYQVFPIAARGIDFVGYKFFHTHTLLRKSIKKNFARMIAFNPNEASIASYKGWAKHCNSAHLLNKLLA